MAFFGLREAPPAALIRIRVLEKQRQIFMGRGMMVFEKKEVVASQLVNVLAGALLGMHSVGRPDPIFHIHWREQVFDGTDLVFFLRHAALG